MCYSGSDKVMTEVRTRCPYCGSEFVVEERHIGVVVKCASCRKPFQVSPIFAPAQKAVALDRRYVKWGLVAAIVAIVLGGIIYALKPHKSHEEDFLITKADVQHYRSFCEIMQKGDMDASIKAMRDVPPGSSESFRRYMYAIADELSAMAGLMKRLEAKIDQAKFAKIWDDERVLAGVHPTYAMVRILDDSNKAVDEVIVELNRMKGKKDVKTQAALKNHGLEDAIGVQLYDELIRVCYMYKGVFKDTKKVYDLYRNNRRCWREEHGDIVVVDRNFVTKINTAMRSLRDSAAAMIAHCQSKERAGMNQARRAVDMLGKGVK